MFLSLKFIFRDCFQEHALESIRLKSFSVSLKWVLHTPLWSMYQQAKKQNRSLLAQCKQKGCLTASEEVGSALRSEVGHCHWHQLLFDDYTPVGSQLQVEKQNLLESNMLILGFFFLIIYFSMKDREKIFYPKVHFPNSCTDQSWSNLKPGSRILFQISCAGIGAQRLEPFSAAFPGYKLAAESEVQISGHELVPYGC